MRLLLFLLLFLLSACGQKAVELPPAKALQASVEQLEQVPFFGPGPFESDVVDSLVFKTSGRSGELALRVWYPKRAKAELPVILFSHGNWSDREKYDALLSVWASYGYAVIAPTHLDGRSMARGIFNSLRFGQLGLIDARVEDMAFLLDNLNNIEGRLLADHATNLSLNRERIVLAGHSFGAFTAQQFAGAIASDNGTISRISDPRVVAVVAISPPGPMFDVIHEESWKTMQGPVLVTTGTWDSNAQFWPDWRTHLMSYHTAAPGDLYSLVIEGADHYLGNLICRPERDADPQRDALNLLNATSVAFLRAYLSGDEKAQAFLKSSRLQTLTQDFAVLNSR